MLMSIACEIRTSVTGQIHESKRGFSLDSGIPIKDNKSQQMRSHSAESKSNFPNAEVMVPLTFEEIDLKMTPLSSQRSCSEYQKKPSLSSFHIESEPKKIDSVLQKPIYKKPSFSIFGTIKKHRIRLAQIDDEEKKFLVDQMVRKQSCRMNSLDDDDEIRNVGGSIDSASSSSSTSNRLKRLISISSDSSKYYSSTLSSSRAQSVCSTKIASKSSSSKELSHIKKFAMNNNTFTVAQAVTNTLEIIFGYAPSKTQPNYLSSYSSPKEIELNLINGIPACYSEANLDQVDSKSSDSSTLFPTSPRSEVTYGYAFYSTTHSERESITSIASSNSVTERSRHHPSVMSSSASHISVTSQSSTVNSSLSRVESQEDMAARAAAPLILNIPLPDEFTYPTLYRVMRLVRNVNLHAHMQKVLMLARSMASLCPWMLNLEVTEDWMLNLSVATGGGSDEQLYEYLRLQPFAFGYYLRAALWAGYGGMIFHTWSLFSWPTEATMLAEPNLQFVCCVVHSYLLAQLVLNALLFTPRLIVHLQCWSCSHLLDMDASLESLRSMLCSDVWQAGRLLGRIQDGVTLLFLLLSQTLLHLVGPRGAAPVRDLLDSLAASALFMLALRVAVATLFSVSSHDPSVLSAARRRGLSRLDTENLPTFVYTAKDEVNNPDCCICLTAFERGEMLISLPCHHRHSFHAACVRQWLTRQNSCPLCQKVV